ncbi:Uu.00g034050.m01.CDS01 [Anthostomella pinea]|uniref:Uu.00g034050.m01.CDS01 n=1 Tax=Anthostomella pinea TaxID=933095 RepID=A0AAI8YDB7_9PEZI|nr:Uu.00g034050.m01.CDS01 [Anthostomella pinea]
MATEDAHASALSEPSVSMCYMGLPTEVRHKILSVTDLVAPKSAISWDLEQGFSLGYEREDPWKTPTHLFLISKTFTEDARAVFFGCNHFRVESRFFTMSAINSLTQLHKSRLALSTSSSGTTHSTFIGATEDSVWHMVTPPALGDGENDDLLYDDDHITAGIFLTEVVPRSSLQYLRSIDISIHDPGVKPARQREWLHIVDYLQEAGLDLRFLLARTWGGISKSELPFSRELETGYELVTEERLNELGNFVDKMVWPLDNDGTPRGTGQLLVDMRLCDALWEFYGNVMYRLRQKGEPRAVGGEVDYSFESARETKREIVLVQGDLAACEGVVEGVWIEGAYARFKNWPERQDGGM